MRVTIATHRDDERAPSEQGPVLDDTVIEPDPAHAGSRPLVPVRAHVRRRQGISHGLEARRLHEAPP